MRELMHSGRSAKQDIDSINMMEGLSKVKRIKVKNHRACRLKANHRTSLSALIEVSLHTYIILFDSSLY
jgi:hypothetical protein